MNNETRKFCDGHQWTGYGDCPQCFASDAGMLQSPPAQPAQAAAAAVKRWAMCPETETPCSTCPTLRIPCEANTAPVVDGGALSAELIRLADIMRDCGRLVSTSGHAERVMRDAAVALSTPQPPAQEAVIRHWSDCATNNRGVPEMLGPCDCGGYIPPAAPVTEMDHA